MFVPVLTGFLIESFVVNFDIYEKNKAGIETISTAKNDEFEMRKLAAERENKRVKSQQETYEIPDDIHPQVKHVEGLLKERKNLEEVEKKIYGFDDIVQKALIKSLRKSLDDTKRRNRINSIVEKHATKRSKELEADMNTLKHKLRQGRSSSLSLEAVIESIEEANTPPPPPPFPPRTP